MTTGGPRPAFSDSDLQLVGAAHSALGWPGVVLPKLRISSFKVFPVVAWLEGGRQRFLQGRGPVTDRPTLSEWEDGGPPTPLKIVGFVSDGPAPSSVDKLKALAAYGAGAMLVPSARRLGRWTLAEADIAGVYVVEHPGSGVRVVLHGRPGSSATRRSVATRLREEQLFAWALHHGVRPLETDSPVGVGSPLGEDLQICGFNIRL